MPETEKGEITKGIRKDQVMKQMQTQAQKPASMPPSREACRYLLFSFSATTQDFTKQALKLTI
jgi:hypothetical protein